MKTYTAHVEFFEYKHCKKVISSVMFSFKSHSELDKKINKFINKSGLKLLHKSPLAQYRNAFDNLPL